MQTAHLNSIYQPNTKYVLANAICLHFCCLTVAIFPVLRVPPNIFFLQLRGQNSGIWQSADTELLSRISNRLAENAWQKHIAGFIGDKVYSSLAMSL